MNLPRLREQLKVDEGYRQFAYDDENGQMVRAPLGKLTIGYGRNLEDVFISEEEASLLLDNDIRRAVAACRSRIEVFAELDDVRQEVIVNMVFNMGVAGVLRFQKTLAALVQKDYDRAAVEMLDSRWATQVGARADRLAKRMRTGEA